MCKDCGCSIDGWHTHADGTSHSHSTSGVHIHHEHAHTHTDKTIHGHIHSHDHKHTHPVLNDSKTIDVITKILSENDTKATSNRTLLDTKNILAINIMSSPGAGKTTLLESTIKSKNFKIAVVEGDLETNQDANRIIQAGAQAYQISTGQSCHLDAFMVEHGLSHLNLDDIDILFVENVGNLVCPASYDVGTHFNVVLLSVPEGDDKISKYPVMFRSADLVVITKISLLPHFDFNLERVRTQLRKLNPKADLIALDSKSGEGIDAWLNYLKFKKELR